jgi:phosphatidylserine/phosphatidylglycerophosphate/cardiolipin synthase-like enzyme
MSRTELLLTGRLFDSAARAIGPVVQELIRGAKRELHLVTYSITPAAPLLLHLIEEALVRGVKSRIIIDHFEEQPPELQRRLTELEGTYEHLGLFNFTDPAGGRLHAKVLVADRRRAVLGSANFTWGGFVKNHELAVLLEGSPARALALAADQIAHACQRGL